MSKMVPRVPCKVAHAKEVYHYLPWSVGKGTSGREVDKERCS